MFQYFFIIAFYYYTLKKKQLLIDRYNIIRNSVIILKIIQYILMLNKYDGNIQ